MRIASVVMALVLAGCAQTPMPAPAEAPHGARLALSDDLQCRILADLGNDLAADNYDPSVMAGSDKIDCGEAFSFAGLPIKTANSQRVRFNAPEFTSDDEAEVRVDFICLRLCGHGELITLHRDKGHWTIAGRKTTWIS